ncbi:MAG: hypothetical protein KAW88_00465 [Candidatus Cloacimonetes bacterium]|nr:hypothetical protein [Candidatus Cloacimonadota bacterium]
MKNQRIYLDTSVIGGCFDKEFHVWSNGLFNSVNLENGYKLLEIFSPREVTSYGSD